MGHTDGVSIAVVAGLPMGISGLCCGLPCSPAGGTGDRPLTGVSWALQTVPCSHQRLPGVPEGAAPLAVPFPWLGTPAGCVQCLPGHSSVPTLPEPPPTAAPSPCPLLWPFQETLERADGWKGCCFLGSSPSAGQGRAWQWLNVLQWGQGRQCCCPAFYSALDSLI